MNIQEIEDRDYDNSAFFARNELRHSGLCRGDLDNDYEDELNAYAEAEAAA